METLSAKKDLQDIFQKRLIAEVEEYLIFSHTCSRETAELEASNRTSDFIKSLFGTDERKSDLTKRIERIEEILDLNCLRTKEENRIWFEKANELRYQNGLNG